MDIVLYLFCLLNPEFIKCSICDIIPNKIYTICKKECFSNIYCNDCINKVLPLCPFTRTNFTKEDIIIDKRANELLSIYMKFKKLKIKNIKCIINIT